MRVEDTYILPDEVTFDKKDMKEQAAASFKAGRKEVVDWIDKNIGTNRNFPKWWAEKKKAWGIE